jgi:hypothetical protein
MNQHSLQWFIDRIGKRIYRKPITACSCDECKSTYIDICDGTTVGKQISRREFHAHYLFDCQNELEIEYSDQPIKE